MGGYVFFLKKNYIWKKQAIGSNLKPRKLFSVTLFWDNIFITNYIYIYRAIEIYKTVYAPNGDIFNNSHSFSSTISEEDELIKDFDHFLATNSVNVTNEKDEFVRYLTDPLLPC